MAHDPLGFDGLLNTILSMADTKLTNTPLGEDILVACHKQFSSK